MSLQVNSKQMLTKTGFMDKNLSFPLWGKGFGVLEYAKQIVFWDKGKGNNTYKELLNTVSLLSNTSLIRPQEYMHMRSTMFSQNAICFPLLRRKQCVPRNITEHYC